MIKATITDVLVYFCEKHQRNHKKGSKVYDECFSGYIDARSKEARNIADKLFEEQRREMVAKPDAWMDRSVSIVTSAQGCERKTEMFPKGAEAVEEKVANYRATRWEYFIASSERKPREPMAKTLFFSPAEMIQFAKSIAIAQGKKWHWWNEKKRKKAAEKMGILAEKSNLPDEYQPIPGTLVKLEGLGGF